MDENSGSFRIKDYLGWPKHVQAMKVPNGPGLYVWTRELPKGIDNAEEINSWLSPALRSDFGLVGPYSSIALHTAAPALTPAKVLLLQESMGQPEFSWTRSMVAQWQRPLYVGISINLRQRLGNHLSYGSRLRQYMAQANYEVVNCRFTYYMPPFVTIVDEWEDDKEEGIDTDQAAPVPESLVRNLRLVESLIIRLAQPYFNQSME